MSEYTDNCKRIIEIIKDRPWLFRKDAPNYNLTEYIKYFEYIVNKSFFLFPTMLPFNIEILDKYKENVFNTSFSGADNGTIAMNTIVQLDVDLHICFLWGNSSNNQKTVLYATLFSVDTQPFREFLINNENLFYNDEKISGFAGLMFQ